MKALRKSSILKNAGDLITHSSNESKKTNSSDNDRMKISTKWKDLIKDLDGISSKLTKASIKNDEVPTFGTSSDVEMQLEVNSIFTTDSISQEDVSVHSQIISEYGRDIIRNMKISESKMTGNLEKHEIKGSHRKQMVVWIEEVLKILKCPVEMFFLSVSIMDRYLENSKERLKLDDLHEIGITSMFIASKYQEIEPLTLDMVIDKIAHKKISEKKLLKREKKILITLKFKLSKPTVWAFIENYCELFESKFGSDEVKTSIKLLAWKIAQNGICDRKLSFTVFPSELALWSLIIAIKSYSKIVKRTILDSRFSEEIKSELTSDEELVLQYGKRLRKLENKYLF